MEILLHLGLAKTGTTALQNALAQNKTELLELHKILWPGDSPNHSHFQTVFSNFPLDLIQSKNESLADISTFRHSFLSRFEEEMTRSCPDIVVISSEYFSSMCDDELSSFRDYLLQFGCVRPVVYLRNPINWAVSVIVEGIRNNLQFENNIFVGAESLFLTINKFERCFGNDLIARLYRGDSNNDWNVIDDFVSLLGTDVNLHHQGQRANPSLSLPAACVIDLLNKEIGGAQIGDLQAKAAHDWFIEAVIDAGSRDTNTLTAEVVDKVVRAVLPEVKRLQDKYFFGRPDIEELMSSMRYNGTLEGIGHEYLSSDVSQRILFDAANILSKRAAEYYFWAKYADNG